MSSVELLLFCHRYKPGADPYRFHRFTEIGRNKYIFNVYIYIYIYIYITLQVEIERWNNPLIYKALSEENGIGQYPVWMIQKPRKFIGAACPLTPLEPCTLGARVGSRSVFILDLCLCLFVTMLIKLLYCVNFNFILNVTFN